MRYDEPRLVWTNSDKSGHHTLVNAGERNIV
jgi:hypothetical protein